MTGRDLPPDLAGKKVLIVRLSALGDVIRTMPAVLGLIEAFPSASFTWLVEDGSAALLRSLPRLELIELERKRLKQGGSWTKAQLTLAVIRRIREQGFDLSVDFHGVLKSALYPLLAGIPVRVGYGAGGSKEGATRFLTHRLERDDWRISRYERNEALARFLAPGLRLPQWRPTLSPEQEALFAEPMRERPLLLFPGTSAHGRNKRWPAKSWADLYHRLSRDLPCLFVFGPEDVPYRTALRDLLGAEAPSLAPMPLTALAGALTRARALVSCDTGPMHLASILGVPLVALLGPSDPVLNQPLPSRSRVVLPGIPCSPCRNRSCQVLICQDFTAPVRVEAEVRSLLAELELSQGATIPAGSFV